MASKPQTSKQRARLVPLSPLASGQKAPPAARDLVPRRALRLRFLAISLLAFSLLTALGIGFRQWQVSRLATTLQTRANEHRAAERWPAAADAYHQLLQLDPHHREARLAVAECFDRGQPAPQHRARSIALYYQAIGVAPEHEPSHRRLAELLLDDARFTAALEQSQWLLKVSENDPLALRISVLAQEGLRQQRQLPLDEKLRQAEEQALAANPNHVAFHVAIAHIWRREAQQTRQPTLQQAADSVIDKLVDSRPGDSQVWLTRYHYRRHFQLPGAAEDLQRAQELAPDAREVVLAIAGRELERRDWSAAIASCQKLHQWEVNLPIVNRIWGDALLGSGDIQGAIQHWEQGAKTYPASSIDYNLRLAAAYLTLKQNEAVGPVLKSIDTYVARNQGRLSESDNMRLRSVAAMLRARWHIQQGEWTQASVLLKSVATLPAIDGQESLERRISAWMMLAERESRLERHDLAADCYEQALTLVPTRATLRLAVAKAHWQAGRLRDALLQVEAATRGDANLAEAWLLSAQLRVAMQARLPLVDRNWEECQQAIAQAERILQGDYRVDLLRLSMSLASNPKQSPGDVLSELQTISRRHPQVAALQAALVIPFEQLHDPTSADQALTNLTRLTGETHDVIFRRIELHLLRKELPKAREQLTALEPSLVTTEVHRAAQLWLRLEALAGTPLAAKDAWLRLAKQAPEDPYPWFLLAELALATAPQDVSQYEQALQRIEGEDGGSWRYLRARRLLGGKSPTDAEMTEAKMLSQWLIKQRKGWSKTWLLSGVLAEQRQDWDRAIQDYQQVVQLDGAQLPVYERLIRILYHQRRFSEVDRFVASIAARGALSTETSLIAIGSAAARQEVDQALSLAESTLQTSPNNIPTALWLAHLQQIKGDEAGALATLTKLLAQAPHDARCWGGRLAFYQAKGDRPGFAQVLSECDATERLAAHDKSLLLAQGYELLGYPERSAAYYQKTLQAGRRELSLQLRLATVQLQFDPALAEKTLRTIRQESPESVAARRMLAIALAAQKRGEAWAEIEDLLQQRINIDAQDVRLEAMLRLQSEHSEDVVEARKLFEHLTAQSKHPLPQDRQVLAFLYEQEGKFDEARREHLALAEDRNATDEQLVNFIVFAVRQRDATTAQAWLNKLERRSPNPWLVRQLRAVILQLDNRDEALAQLLEELETQHLPIQLSPQRVAFRINMANIYGVLNRPADTERHLRALANEEPQQLATLVRWLNSQQRSKAALETCLAASDEKLTTLQAQLLIETIPNVPEGVEQLATAEEQLATLQRSSEDAAFLSALSNLRLLQHRGDEALQLLHRIVKLAPDDAVSLNNLAALLADQPGQQAAALELIDRAIVAAPRPQPFLFDTRAKVLLHQNRPQEALAELERTVARWPNTDPRVYLHLSMAFDRLGRRQEARAALAQARERGLQTQQLTTGDRLQLDELDIRLARVAPTMNDLRQPETATP